MNIKAAFAAILVGIAISASAQDIPSKYEVVPLGMTTASGMNNTGHIVGGVQTRVGSPARAALWSNGTLTQVPLEKGYRESNLTWVGSNNVIVGNSITTSRKKQVGFKLEDDKLTWLPALGGIAVSPTGINKDGVIVGMALNASKQQRAFIYNGKMTDLGTLGGNSAWASRINDSGLVIGWSAISPSSIIQHAFAYDGAKMVDLTAGYAKNSWAYGLNNGGDIVGAMDTDSKRRAVLWSGGKTTFLTSDFGIARGINVNKVVVGTMEVPFEQTIEGEVFRTSTLTPFVWANGVLVDLNKRIDSKSGWTLGQGLAINDKGEVLVLGTKDGKQQAVLLKPAL